MLDFAPLSRPLALTLCVLLIIGCGEQSHDATEGDLDLEDYGAGLSPDDDAAMPDVGNDDPASSSHTAPASSLGNLTVTDATTTYDLTVTDCSMTSAPSVDAAIATLRLNALRVSEPAADGGAFTLEFQVQELPDLRGVALLSFESASDDLIYTGTSGRAEAGSYTLTVGGSTFDVTSGSNGALEPVGSGYAEPLPVAVESAFTVAAQRLTDDDAAPASDATLAVTLTSRCELSWRLDS